jgi:mannose-6-phosphate isomerase-like protein (cupin superfamily)
MYSNPYNTNSCSYCCNQAMYNSNNMYNAYRAYPCPYYSNTPMYNLNFTGQYTDQYSPFTDEMNYDSGSDFSRAEKGNVATDLKDYGPQPFVVNINEVTKQNDTFRTALWTGTHLQLTLMSINVGEDIGLEMHPNVDQFLRVEEGQGIVGMGTNRHNLNFQRNVSDDFAILIPAGTWHNVINTGNTPLKLYSIYAPPQHPRGTVHETKADAQAAEQRHT